MDAMTKALDGAIRRALRASAAADSRRAAAARDVLARIQGRPIRLRDLEEVRVAIGMPIDRLLKEEVWGKVV